MKVLSDELEVWEKVSIRLCACDTRLAAIIVCIYTTLATNLVSRADNSVEHFFNNFVSSSTRDDDSNVVSVADTAYKSELSVTGHVGVVPVDLYFLKNSVQRAVFMRYLNNRPSSKTRLVDNLLPRAYNLMDKFSSN